MKTIPKKCECGYLFPSIEILYGTNAIAKCANCKLLVDLDLGFQLPPEPKRKEQHEIMEFDSLQKELKKLPYLSWLGVSSPQPETRVIKVINPQDVDKVDLSDPGKFDDTYTFHEVIAEPMLFRKGTDWWWRWKITTEFVVGT